MKIEAVPVSDALELAKSFPYAMLTQLSAVTLGRTPENLDPSEWIEAHFFDGEKELRILSGQTQRKAFLLSEIPEDVVIDEIAKLRPGFGKSLTIRKYLAFDEDGQGYIAAMRFTDWKEA